MDGENCKQINTLTKECSITLYLMAKESIFIKMDSPTKDTG